MSQTLTVDLFVSVDGCAGFDGQPVAREAIAGCRSRRPTGADIPRGSEHHPAAADETRNPLPDVPVMVRGTGPLA